MLHWYIVGHFDPNDPVDKSEKPYRPRVLRPIPLAVAEQAEKEFGPDVSEYLSYCDTGCVYCNWSFAKRDLWSRVMDFAFFLADREHAMVIDENYMFLRAAELRFEQMKSPRWSTSTDADISDSIPGTSPPDPSA
jgi:hypothetical protein